MENNRDVAITTQLAEVAQILVILRLELAYELLMTGLWRVLCNDTNYVLVIVMFCVII